MADYRLHCFAESGNSYKPALMLALAGCAWEPVVVDYFGGQTRDPAFRGQVNAQGEAPVLEHRGRTLSQSGVILTYLAEQTGLYGPRTEDERLEILRWILFDNHKFTSYFATLRFMVGIQKTGETPVTEFLRARALGAWGIVEAHLAGRPFLLGARPTIADLSLAGYVYFREETGIDRAAFPAINAWAERIAGLPGWRAPWDLLPPSTRG
ncbi:glutathione S-transferase family protein [Zavarzinia sp. CC-PAN008]|uniref:glutathione S-transferase family protein n=1 Tax=Zavarzinia sp. CC-PAN008 TaxID=3243332 RepID=UPI003F7471E5